MKMEEKTINKTRSNGRTYTIRLSRDRIFMPEEWIKFYFYLKESQRTTFNVLINTGARINEARGIQVKDIDFIKKEIVLRRIKGKNSWANGKVRIVPISKKFCGFLKRLIKDKKLLSEDYLPILSTPAANIGMKKSLIKANIEDWRMFSVHNVRKTLESWLMLFNVGDLKIILHFGHSKSIALRHYLTLRNINDKSKNLVRKIIGNLYFGDGFIDDLYSKIRHIELQLNREEISRCGLDERKKESLKNVIK